MSLLPRTPPRIDAWTTTRWSTVASLDQRDDPSWETSWAHLVTSYRGAMEGFARRLLSRLRGRPCPPGDAAALVQDFLGVCVEKAWLSRADPAKGRFRAYVQTLLRRYVYRHLEHERAQRRSPGPGRKAFSLLDVDGADDGLATDGPDIEAFDRSWAEVAVERARERLRGEHERYVLVIDDLIRTGGEGSAELPEALGVRPAQFPVLKHRARQRFLKLFEQELAATVADEEAFREEWRALLPYLP